MPNHENTIEGQFLDLFLYMGSEWVLYLLLILSVISLAITFERILHFVQRKEDLDRLQRELDAHLTSGDMAAAREMLSSSRSHVATVILKGMDAFDRGAHAVEETVAGASQLERLKMERGLAFLGTLGNNAPFIGLFGTVLGIIRAFRDLAANTMEGAQAVMAGIAEALVATAVGLLVALPAVAIFNAFQRKVRKELVASDAISRVLLAHVKSNGKQDG